MFRKFLANEEGTVQEYLIILFVVSVVLIGLTFFLFKSGHWILGSLLVAFFLLPNGIQFLNRLRYKRLLRKAQKSIENNEE